MMLLLSKLKRILKKIYYLDRIWFGKVATPALLMNGCKVPDDFEEYLRIRGSFVGYDYNEQKPTWKPEIITNQDSKLVGKFYGTFEGESDFLLKIEPGASFRRIDRLIQLL